ncbi:hypothetical protein BGZ60DRAFT_225798 [Tricladium varicosporioides]|nr:hypothetical protein BGZ60DRAFT_225798 [Hymenoscyphus varicosporioides]
MHLSQFSTIVTAIAFFMVDSIAAASTTEGPYNPSSCYTGRSDLWLATCYDSAKTSFSECSRSVGFATLSPGHVNCGCNMVLESARCDSVCNPAPNTYYSSYISRACGTAPASGAAATTTAKVTGTVTGTTTGVQATSTSSQNAGSTISGGLYRASSGNILGIFGGLFVLGAGATAFLL